jgi:DNA-binding NarL/FixJ family response regulator
MLAEHPDLRVVGEAIDGVEAVQKAQELKPDLILLDISLPGLNGIEAARRILGIVPDAKILFVTSNVDGDVAAAALSDGAFGYVLKADGKSELLRAINAVLQGEKVVSKRLKP